MMSFDVIVIGGGPGGYVAAIKGAQLGLKVACIEKRETLGGTCLNEGCIPSKALLHSSELYHKANKEFIEHGIELSGIKLSLDKMMSRKTKVVGDLCKGIEGLFAKNKVTKIKGRARILSATQVEVETADGKKELVEGKNIIIATGSAVSMIPNITVNEKNIVSSTGALDLQTVPKKMIVVGGGYIGLELGSVWNRLGSEVTVVEYLDRIVPAIDYEIGNNFQKILSKQGLNFKLGFKVLGAKESKEGVSLEIENAKTGEKENLEANVILMSIGRKPYTEGLGLEALNIKQDKIGRIEIDSHFRTSLKNIYAIGDVIAGPMLAHKAEEEGVAVVEIIAGQAGHVNYETIPSVVYTSPEVASVGLTEEQVKEKGIDYKVGKFPFLANSRAKANGEAEGMVKIIAAKGDDRILGAHIIGPDAGHLIEEIVVAMEYKASSEDLARICHPHPTMSEAIKEASLATFFKPIHI
jgi:dihydrolipoamide dehydrogenase